MTRDDLDTLSRLEQAATKGPWAVTREGIDTYVRDATGNALACDMQYYPWTFEPEDAALIAAMRNALPDLLAAERFRQQMQEMQGRIASMAYGRGHYAAYNGLLREILALLERPETTRSNP